MSVMSLPMLIHIGEVAALLFVAYQLGWFVGFIVRRLSTPRTRPQLVVTAPVAAAANPAEALVRAPIIEPVPSALPVSDPVRAEADAAEPVVAPVEAARPVELVLVEAPATVSSDVTPLAVPTVPEADVSPPGPILGDLLALDPPVEEVTPPLSEDFLAEFQSVLLEPAEPPEPPEPDARTDAAAQAAMEAAFDLRPRAAKPATLFEPPEPELFDQPRVAVAETVPEIQSARPSPEPVDPPAPDPVAVVEPVAAVAPRPEPEVPAPPMSPPPAPVEAAPAPAPRPAPSRPTVRPATRPGAAVEGIVPTPKPILPKPSLKPASKPGEAWSGRGTAQRRPATMPGAPAATAPESPAALARDAVASAAAKVQEVVAANAAYDDGMEASDEDAEAAAMRAIESGWSRRLPPRKPASEPPEGVKPIPRKPPSG
jgi:hypothetical protein